MSVECHAIDMAGPVEQGGRPCLNKLSYIGVKCARERADRAGGNWYKIFKRIDADDSNTLAFRRIPNALSKPSIPV